MVFTANEIRTKFKEMWDKIRPETLKTRQADLNNPSPETKIISRNQKVFVKKLAKVFCDDFSYNIVFL